MVPSRALEEPVSPELALVDPDLAFKAREASADPPWLLPAVAETRQRVGAAPGVSIKERPAPKAVADAERPSFSRHLRSTAVLGFAVVALVTVLTLALELVPGPAKPTLANRRAEPAASAPPTKPHSTHSTKARSRKTRSTPTPTKNPKRSARAASAPRQAAKPKGPAAVTFERAFSWRLHRGAVYYQVHLQRGAKTIYEARTLKRTASIRLQLRPGKYRAVVRPAFPTDAGIILGPAILDKIVRA